MSAILADFHTSHNLSLFTHPTNLCPSVHQKCLALLIEGQLAGVEKSAQHCSAIKVVFFVLEKLSLIVQCEDVALRDHYGNNLPILEVISYLISRP